MNKLFLLLLLVTFNVVNSQPLISFDTVVTGLSQPVDVEEVNDSSHRLFIVEQKGTIRIIDGTTLSPEPFLDVTSKISFGGERGLLSLAFHPDYVNNGYFYIYYTNIAGDITVARYSRLSANLADSSSGVVLLTIPKPFANHNGGNLIFGSDGYLYFGTGDGGSAGDPFNNAQSDTSLLGKMLRIDVNNPNPPYYNIPPTNPFANSTTAKKEIIAIGLRNPWRWSFDKQTGDMWIADVGQGLWEEVNMVKKDSLLDKNYGWKCFEATHLFGTGCPAQPNNILPVFEYPHNDTTGGYSITGGYMYRGGEFPALQGYYICVDFSTANGWLLRTDGNGGWSSSMQKNWPYSLSSFGETANGTLYAVTLDGVLYKVVANNPLPIHLVSFAGKETGNEFEINWRTETEEAGDIYIIERRTSLSEPYAEVSRTVAVADRSSGNYSVKLPLSNDRAYYRLKIISKNGRINYSQIISSNGAIKQMLRTFITGTNLFCKLPAATTSVEIFDVSGKLVLQQQTSPADAQINISLANVAKGVITVRAFAGNDLQVVRVLY